jgi:alpha-beta hydrolase superfamily lysophospholipase
LILVVFALTFLPLSALALTDSSASGGPNPNDRITYVEDGDLFKAIGLPTYEWIPKESQPVGLVLAVHGLTLNGKRYEVVLKDFAANGYYTCSFDMRGFGRCYTDRKFWTPPDSKDRIDYSKSLSELEQIASTIKKRYPGLPLYVMGESLGTILCIELAAERHDLVDGLILSGPVVKVHPLMYIHPKVIEASTVGYFMKPRFQINTDAFVKYLVSEDPDVVQELLSDPLCRKGLKLGELLQTDNLVKKALWYARRIKQDEPVLVLQGSLDRCMVPRAITDLSKRIPSSDQTLRWLHEHGHLLLETAYVRPSTMNALYAWMREQNGSHTENYQLVQKELIQLGARPDRDQH